jgi:two-component system sensor histidine kinase UhpB
VRESAASLRLSVQDDGRGMDTAAATRGLGLLGAVERAAAVGGELAISSLPGAGVHIELRVPLASSEAAP